MITKLKLQWRIMFLALRKSGFRSLVAVGVVGLGIAAMMIMLAISAGAERELEAITDKMGKNLFTIKAGQVLFPPGRGSGWYRATTLGFSDVDSLRTVRGVHRIVPVLEGSLPVKLGRKELVTSIRGVSPEFLDVRNFQLAEGRALDAQDDLSKSRVAVAGAFVADRLNDGFSLVGERVWIGGAPFEIVGQLAGKGMSPDGQNEDDQILIPMETARRRVFNVDYLSRLLVQVENERQMTAAQAEAREVLRAGHRLDENAKDDFEVLSLVRVDQIRKVNSAVLEGLSQILAAITLAIGGAGVLAVTYLNVKDRTSEIGLRMAIGARRRDISSLFVAEACVLSLLGGVAGLLAGAAGIVILTQAVGWQMAVDVGAVSIPLVVSLLLGLVFGVFPALKASRVTPVEALRDAA